MYNLDFDTLKRCLIAKFATKIKVKIYVQSTIVSDK